jgi:putative transposase
MYVRVMKLVVEVRLLPGPEQSVLLAETLARCNAAANLASERAFVEAVTRRFDLHHRVYRELKEFGLSAQPAIRTIAKVLRRLHQRQACPASFPA